MVVLAIWVATLLYRSAPDHEPTGLVLDRTRAACWVVPATAAAGSVAVTWLLGGLRTGSWFDEVLAVRIATRTISLTLAAGRGALPPLAAVATGPTSTREAQLRS